MAKKINSASIQKHLPLKEIKDGVVVLKNNSLRAILMASSFNFALKSKEEQDAIIYRYQDFLNSIDFPLQLLVGSRKFDISNYLDVLRQKQMQQENDLLKIQTTEYIEFVKSLTEVTNIMTESFYIVIPYSGGVQQKKGILSNLFSSFSGNSNNKEDETKEMNFAKRKNNLWQRVDFVSTGLQALGVKTAPLNSEELIELFYKLYNPSAKEELELKKAKTLRNQ